MVVKCQECRAFVEADEIGNYEYPRTEKRTSGRVVLLKCKRCDSPILVSQDNVGNMAEGDMWDEPICLYPSGEFRVNRNAPTAIQRAYEEAIASFGARAYTAAAIMSRKTLEGICLEHGVKAGPLVKSLKKMKDNGVLDDRLYEWSDALRMAGNEAAHDPAVVVSGEDAKDILDFTNAVIDYLYSFRSKFDQFKKRRQKH